MKKTIFLILLGVIFLSGAFSDTIVETDDFFLSLEFKDDKLLVVLKAETTGWISFGIGPQEEVDIMKGANILIAWVDDSLGIAMGEDHYGSGRFAHKEDLKLGGSQDMEILSGAQTKTHTTVTFTIPLDSGDENDTVLEQGGAYRVLLASGKNDNIGRKHDKRFAEDVILR